MVEIPQRLLSAIKQGKVVLFLGAGANYNCKMSNSERMPTSSKLSELISQKFNVRIASNLSETAELVEATTSRLQLNSYIVELLTGAIPSEGFSLIPSFKWEAIYTTNYDLLIEDIYQHNNSIQNLKVYYTSHQYIDLGVNDVPLYKLHGCISRADTDEGRLVITPDDFAEYRRNRHRLFNRLADHLSDRIFLYLGYGRNDSNFREILADVQREMRGDNPEGYALFPEASQEDELVWKNKGVTLIDADVDNFLEELNKLTQDRTTVHDSKINFPILEQYSSIELSELDELLTYFDLPIPEFGSNSFPTRFYKGSEADWIDINNNVDAQRDLYEEVMTDLIEDAVSIENHVTVYSFLAEAGAGKSTLLRRISFDLCNDFGQVVFWYKGQRRINFEEILNVYRQTNKRIYLFIDRGSRFINNLDNLRRDCIASSIPITIIVADRINEWNYSSGGNFKFTKQWILSKLSDNEINGILDRLEHFNCLGNLIYLTREQRFKRFKEYSDRQLLVALREATEGKDFDELIIEESDSIPNINSKRAYYNICFLHAFGNGIRPRPLASSLGLNLAELGSILKDLEGLIDYKEETYTARHSIISKIILFSVAEQTRVSMLEELISHLDLGYTTDYHTYRGFMINEELIDSIGGIDSRRRVFASLKAVNPNDWYLEQHEARMEFRALNEGGTLERSEKLIKKALKASNNAVVIRHTAGQLYYHKAMNSTGIEKRANLLSAVNEFNELRKRAPESDYVWTSLIESRVALASTSDLDEGKSAELIRAEEDYQKAIENCGSTPYLLRAKGRLEAAWGNGEQARVYYQKAISGEAPPSNLLSNYIKWELRHNGIELAREVSKKAVNIYNLDPEILILRARSLILGKEWELSEVIPLLIDAERMGSNFYKMEAYYWHGVALWEKSRYQDSMQQFNKCKNISLLLDKGDFKLVRYISGKHKGELNIFNGSIVDRGPRSAWLICNPGGIKVFINPKYLIENGQNNINVKIGFNRIGPVAIFNEENYDTDIL